MFDFSKTCKKGELEKQSTGWFHNAATNGIVLSVAQRPGGLNGEPFSSPSGVRDIES